MRTTILICLLSCSGLLVYAQQSSIYSQYMFNGLAINPAYAGHDGMLSVTALARFQGVGLEGSPKTQTFSIHTPIVEDKVGVGFQIYHENVGVTDQTALFASYSYKLNFNSFSIAFGLQGGLNIYNTSFTQLRVINPGDPVFSTDQKSVRPNIGSGVFLSGERFYAGASIPQMLSVGDASDVVLQEKPIIVYGGYVMDINSFMKLKPSMLIKMVSGQAVEWNINASVLFNDILWLGASFRPVNTVVFMMELQATEQMQIGYAYDATTGDLRTIEGGSHEIMINYRFRYSQKGIISPRYF